MPNKITKPPNPKRQSELPKNSLIILKNILDNSSKTPNRITHQFQPTKLVYQRTAQNAEVIYQRTAPNCRSELPKNSSKTLKKLFDLIEAKAVLIKRTIREQLQNSKEKYQRNLPENNSKTSKRTKKNRTPKRANKEDQKKLLKKNFEESSSTFWSCSLVELPKNSSKTSKKTTRKQLQIAENNNKKYKASEKKKTMQKNPKYQLKAQANKKKYCCIKIETMKFLYTA
ncbi:hypothetical protein C2G38_2035751 [Gigaspora rosea]|uniref:Uncharacterized protein n=1 Tax=Gigaspora rosea TaxID=44941 RepID=A0A397VFQ8_9GLOM|nr:hypothetical protein C2G38_2035751 [Gigaspora rosea]